MSIGAGVVATGADAVCFAALDHAGVPPGTSALAGAAIGGVVGYAAQRRWVFASDAPVGSEAVRYVAVSASSGAVHALLVGLLVYVIEHPLAAWALSRSAVFAGHGATDPWPARRIELFDDGLHVPRGLFGRNVAGDRVDVKSLITHSFPLSQAREAFELVSHAADNVLKASVDQ